MSQRLHGRPFLHKTSPERGISDRGNECRRCREDDYARAEDDEHRDRLQDVPAPPPQQQSQDNGCRRIQFSVAIEHPFDGRFLFLGIRNKPADLAERGLGPDPGCKDLDCSVLVEGAGEDGIPCLLLHRYALPGDCRLVDGSRSKQDLPIDSDPFPGTHDEKITDNHLVRGKEEIFTITPDGHPVGQQPGQRIKRPIGTGGNEFFKQPAEKKEYGDDGGGGVLPDRDCCCRGKRDRDISGKIAFADPLDGAVPDERRSHQSSCEIYPVGIGFRSCVDKEAGNLV
ncbi:MAG: hypothetical protein BWX50_00973 [Euryarchaeota archaeon ADurb.Bin009]|nr:MAG: hypothetical protein BWX50_00973 [Euryarchaeota archaeon ADurb.Bin009]